jgi:hypothetical protein
VRQWAVASVWLVCGVAAAQRIELPSSLPQVHPRIAAVAGSSHEAVMARLKADPAAQTELKHAQDEMAPYVAYVRSDPMWLASRLQMYWKSHATEVDCRGDVFDHVEGHGAVATVRYPGSRDPLTTYRAPQLEEIPEYEDDTKGVLVASGAGEARQLVWASPAKAGRIVDGINSNIVHIASDAAKLYWITGDEDYARVAWPVLDTYLRGMVDRRVPVDLNHGHSQTIYGLSTFEVIQEGVLRDIASTYDYLYGYAQKKDASAIPVYAIALKQWAEVQIKNGVPFNNWDLIEARWIAAVALVLDNDGAYADGHGEQYFLNAVLNDSVTRQWSLRKLAEQGFDAKTGIWFESPGYSMGVTKDFITLINDLDRALGADMLLQLPVVEKAVLANGQYLYPNGYTVSFGDGHHVLLASTAAREMVKNARMHHRPAQEATFTAMAKLLETNAAAAGHPEAATQPHGLDTLLAPDDLHLDAAIAPMRMSELTSPLFSAPSVSYFVQRNGLDAVNGLMAAEAGSLGNHQHANGITLELYGLGMVLAPESGIGSNYFEADHAEYYSQFVASNTVAVDGISSYPTMLSHHGFVVMGSYAPAGGVGPVTFSDVYFHEPETDADQRRQVSIVRTSAQHGYYVDIFRSRRRDGNDKMHDYFFHGLGQQMALTDAASKPLRLQPTEELTFANEELPGYDYFFDKQEVRYAGDMRATFSLATPGKNTEMNLWMAGSGDRTIFAVKAPASHAVGDFLPKDVAALPMPTLVARQAGEAWNRPFVVVFEPTDANHPTGIASIARFMPAGAPKDFVGLEVRGTDGSRQRIFSTADGRRVVADGVEFEGTFGVAGEGDDRYLVLGRGRSIARDGVGVRFESATGAAELHAGAGEWRISMNEPGKLMVPVGMKLGDRLRLVGDDGKQTEIVGSGVGQKMEFAIPAIEGARLVWMK